MREAETLPPLPLPPPPHELAGVGLDQLIFLHIIIRTIITDEPFRNGAVRLPAGKLPFADVAGVGVTWNAYFQHEKVVKMTRPRCPFHEALNAGLPGFQQSLLNAPLCRARVDPTVWGV